MLDVFYIPLKISRYWKQLYISSKSLNIKSSEYEIKAISSGNDILTVAKNLDFFL